MIPNNIVDTIGDNQYVRVRRMQNSYSGADSFSFTKIETKEYKGVLSISDGSKPIEPPLPESKMQTAMGIRKTLKKLNKNLQRTSLLIS